MIPFSPSRLGKRVPSWRIQTNCWGQWFRNQKTGRIRNSAEDP
jgi:hypothetical protein